MFGYFLHVIMVILAVIILTTAIVTHIRHGNKLQYDTHFILFFGIFGAFICGGYGLVGIYPDLDTIFIPRGFGFWGVDAFLLTELSYGLFELKYNKTVIYFGIGSSTLYALFDIILNDRKNAVVYIKNDYYTSFTPNEPNHLLFHYIFLLIIGSILIVLSTLWYKSKKTKIEKDFVSKVIFSNYVLLLSGIPYIFGTKLAEKYPTFLFSIGFAFVYFMWLRATKKRISINVDVKNISQEIFYTIDVPVIIITTEGKLALSNPCAKEQLKIVDEKNTAIRDLFIMSDVDELRILAKSKKREDYQLKVRTKASDADCLLKCSVKCDYTGEPFCIICTAIFLNPVIEDEKRNI